MHDVVDRWQAGDPVWVETGVLLSVRGEPAEVPAVVVRVFHERILVRVRHAVITDANGVMLTVRPAHLRRRQPPRAASVCK